MLNMRYYTNVSLEINQLSCMNEHQAYTEVRHEINDFRILSKEEAIDTYKKYKKMQLDWIESICKELEGQELSQ